MPLFKSRRILAAAAALALLPTAAALAQDAADREPPKPASDVDKMVRDGMGEALEARFGAAARPDEWLLVAQAYKNKAQRAKQPAERRRAFDKSEEIYRRAIAALEKSREGLKGAVALVAARLEYASAIVSGQVAGELDEFEITAGQRGDREQLIKLLGAAREEYTKAEAIIKPLYDERATREDEFFAEGVSEAVAQHWLDTDFNLAWVHHYLAMLEPDELKKKDQARLAEQRFQRLVDSGSTGTVIFRCYLGLALSQIEQGRYDDAARNLNQARQEGADRVTTVQAQFELGRCHLAAKKYDEARAALKPLVDKNLRELPQEDRPARFYINLANLWDANSYLLEADAARKEADATPAARRAILQKADRLRQDGLARFNKLSQMGGAWPALVQIYVAATVNMRADPKELSPTELLYSATTLMDARKFRDAMARLQEAAGRPDLDPALQGQILFELGRCQFRLDDLRSAAASFSRVATTMKSHASAPQAATFAYQIWAKLAKQSNKKEDYQALADTLLNLIQAFPDHPERAAATWWLPVALQYAGKYAEAAEQFGNVPENSEHREEAQQRRGVCARLALEAQRATLPAEEYGTRAKQVVATLLKYSDESAQRAEQAIDRKSVLKWSAEARLQAGELLIAPGVEQFKQGLDTVADFEKRFPDSPLVGRALSIRIRAHRGLREFDQASKILEQYLQAVPADQAGGTLAVLAKGMQEEVDRLRDDGDAEAAKKLARESLVTFDELEKWISADEKRAKSRPVVAFGRAQMLYYAGEHAQALDAVGKLLATNPKDGNYQHLQAMILTDSLGDGAAAAQIDAAREAWARLLADQTLRTKAPSRFWEARYHWLALTLRGGAAGDVEKAIKQDRVWFPDLGGPPWKERLEELYRAAAEKAGVTADAPRDDEPATRPATPETP